MKKLSTLHSWHSTLVFTLALLSISFADARVNGGRPADERDTRVALQEESFFNDKTSLISAEDDEDTAPEDAVDTTTLSILSKDIKDLDIEMEDMQSLLSALSKKVERTNTALTKLKKEVEKNKKK